MMFENPEKYSVNIFVTPGIDYVNNYKLVDDILDMIEESRGDSIYIVTTPDKPFGANDGVDDMYTQDDVVELLDASGIDSYYVATYYPWCQYFDKENSIYVNLPVTRDVVRNMADVDNKKYPWYAPAGTERGNVKCEKARLYTKTPVEDVLYDGMINPVKSFAKDGVKVWGNKTVYRNETSPMNRINVVRMMLYMRKLIIESSRALIFEQNDSSLAKTFEGIVKPLLNQIKKDRGLYDFVLQVSQTPEQIDAHELSAKLLVKPTPTLEYIEIEFVVSPTSVDFNTL
jgi:phage tail sheath protein FI